MSRNLPLPLAEIFRQIGEGRLVEAEALCRRALESAPDDVNVLGMLGAILLRTGRSAEAERLLLRSIELEPAFAKPHEDLGLLYLERGDAARAVSSLERALELDETLAAARRGIAAAMPRLPPPASDLFSHRPAWACSPKQQSCGRRAKLHGPSRFASNSSSASRKMWRRFVSWRSLPRMRNGR
jgi:Tfp pilus assembly protein PilF